MKEGKESNTEGFSEEELAAMKERRKELGAGRRNSKGSETEGEEAVLSKILLMQGKDRTLALRLHDLIMETSPALCPRTWYGMPAYSLGGKVVCFFQPALKFKTRYATLGFSDMANIDEGSMWPTSFALLELGDVEVNRIRNLIRRAVEP